jgi:predicted DNA binding CopG/RHH family protein
MKKRIEYTNEPMELEVVKDFLPPPEQLVLKEDKVKVTIELSRESVDFFKGVAAEHGAPYQKMIRRVLDTYASRYGKRRGAKRPHRRLAMPDNRS